VGTYVKSFVVDGEAFELYAQIGDGDKSYQLVDGDSLAVGEPFDHVPQDAIVADLVRASREVGEGAA
jgi:hypothetical protein